MPFQRKDAWPFPWEKDAEQGREFIKTISAWSVVPSWTRALRATSRSGVLVICFHDKPLGVMGSPRILRDILLEWRGVSPREPHATIDDELALLADSAQPTRRQPFRSRSLGVRQKPGSVAKLLRLLAEQGEIAAVLHYHRTYVWLIPLGLLARFRLELKQSTTQWPDDVLNWACQSEGPLL